MTEPDKNSDAAPAARPVPPAVQIVPRRRASPFAALLPLALIAALAAGGWYGWQWYEQTRGEAARRAELLTRLEQELKTIKQQSAEQQQKQLELAGSVAALGSVIEGGRARMQLAAVEQLLLLANDRLLLAHDADGARGALELADRRIAALKDPRLLPVREALAAELAALAALPQVDTAGAALALKQIVRDAPRFALRARVPERFEPQPRDAPLPPDANAAQHIWGAIKTALSAIFTLRRTEGPALRLLAPEEEQLAARILQLKLEGARIALLSGDGAALRDLAAGAADWLRTYYNDGDAAVRGALTELDRIGALEPSPAPPDISRSLTLLRAQLAGAQ